MSSKNKSEKRKILEVLIQNSRYLPEKTTDLKINPTHFLEAVSFMFGENWPVPDPKYTRQHLDDMLGIKIPPAIQINSSVEFVQMIFHQSMNSKLLRNKFNLDKFPIKHVSSKSLRSGMNTDIASLLDIDINVYHIAVFFRACASMHQTKTAKTRYLMACDIAKKNKKYDFLVKREIEVYELCKNEDKRWSGILGSCHSEQRCVINDLTLRDLEQQKNVSSVLGNEGKSSDKKGEESLMIPAQNTDDDAEIDYVMNKNLLKDDWQSISQEMISEKFQERSKSHRQKYASSKEFMDDREMSHWALCPLSGQIMTNPVIACDLITYEETAWNAWVRDHDDSPFIDRVLTSKGTRPNRVVKQAISIIYDTKM